MRCAPPSSNVTWNTTSGTWDTRDRQLDRRQPGGQSLQGRRHGDSSGTSPASSTITVAPGGVSPLAVQISNAANKYTFTGGPINGSGGLTVSGPGSVALTASNGYSGNTTLNGGTLIVDGGDNRLGSGLLFFNGGTLQTTSSGINSGPATRTMYVNSGTTSWGTPARPLDEFKKVYAHLARLPSLAGKVKEISRQLAEGRKKP